jgi:hypothetical protein
MGCVSSGPAFVPNLKKPGQGTEVHHISKLLRLSKADVDKLYRSFNGIDVDGSGLISISEFIVVFKLAEEHLATCVFLLGIVELGDQVDFFTFVVTLWAYLTYVLL